MCFYDAPKEIEKLYELIHNSEGIYAFSVFNKELNKFDILVDSRDKADEEEIYKWCGMNIRNKLQRIVKDVVSWKVSVRVELDDIKTTYIRIETITHQIGVLMAWKNDEKLIV